jgi:pimeloyl-ACP methyl ester carboxylesterase
MLPGMGATSAMYGGPWRDIPDARAIDWPGYQGEKTIAQIATRLIAEYNIRPSDWVIGSSLGGIVALEIHAMLNLQRVVLLGGAVTPTEINPLLVALAPLAKITPMRLIQYLAGKSDNLLSTMYAEVDADFVRAMCIAVSRWDGYTGDMNAVTRIHGERDHIIRPPKTATIIPNAGHLIAMTHAEECIAMIPGATPQ